METMDRTGSQRNPLSAHSCCQGAAGTSSSRWSACLPTWLRGRWGVILGASALAIGGAALGWPWLVAIGIAPILLSILPCAVMCALGLCMMGRGMNSAGSQNARTDAATMAAAPSPLGGGSEAVSALQAREPERITLS